jgi:hypothetical protein
MEIGNKVIRCYVIVDQELAPSPVVCARGTGQLRVTGTITCTTGKLSYSNLEDK